MQIQTTGITRISDTPVKVYKIPGENEKVYTKDGVEYELRDVLNKGGGEGIIYRTNLSDNIVAKIYKEGKITRRKEEKLKFMVQKKLRNEGICFPIELLYNQREEFVGYLMPLAKGDTLKNSLFGKPQFMDHFPDWKKFDVVELALTILYKMKYLHDRGIFIGDIKGENILVVSSKEVYFVDTDSYQVGNFPCPVISEAYTPPELINRRCSSFLRTAGNENFALATLLFKIVMQGLNPYAHVGGTDPLENIRTMNFSFPSFGKSNFMTPGGITGPYYCCWDHLSQKIRESFYNTFSKDGSTNTEATRPNVNQWIEIFELYDYHLRNRLKPTDESNKVYPQRLRLNGEKGLYCKAGNHTVREKGFSGRGKIIGVCKECLGSSFENTLYYCKCGKEISYTGFHHYIKDIPVPVSGECECSDCNPSSPYAPVGKNKNINKNLR